MLLVAGLTIGWLVKRKTNRMAERYADEDEAEQQAA